MKKKLLLLSAITLLLALTIFTFSYFMYHYMTPDGVWSDIWSPTPGKPYLTLLFSIWGVTFLSCSVMSTLSALIFFPKTKR